MARVPGLRCVREQMHAVVEIDLPVPCFGMGG